MEKQLASGSAPAAETSERQRPPVPMAAPWLIFPHGEAQEVLEKLPRHSLGDHVLFMCTNKEAVDLYSSKCYSTSSASCSVADMGLERGCLFYTLPEDQTLYVYEVEDSGTTTILPCLHLPTPWFQPTWMMMPTTVDRAHCPDEVEAQDTLEALHWTKIKSTSLDYKTKI
ncbi:hypothetical protein C5167_019966 [Papaver somniferum]|uniref:DUF295 domain-containing protein n=1 Tax=Papaver somniferum TaxID=3469 RepID=A0A4Y7IUW9_PAPSO|nr:hypothetical protein C5167_019966 [Papaver somniferum]